MKEQCSSGRRISDHKIMKNNSGVAMGFPARVYTCTHGPVYTANQEHPHKQPKASGSTPASFWGERRGRPDAW